MKNDLFANVDDLSRAVGQGRVFYLLHREWQGIILLTLRLFQRGGKDLIHNDLVMPDRMGRHWR